MPVTPSPPTGNPGSGAVRAEVPSPTRRPRWYLEVLAIIWLLWVYDAVTGLITLRRVAPYQHAASLLKLEQSLHLDPEHALNHWLAGHHTLGLWVSDYYDNMHFIVTLAVIGWLWWRHPAVYRPLRTSLVLTNIVAFFVFWAYPMAPPRLLDPARYADIVANTHAIGSWHSGSLAKHANELAAMPSLHLSWAVWSAYAMWRVWRSRRAAWLVWLVWLYPLATTYAVMATGNHFLSDAVAGTVLMILCTIAANRAHEWWASRRVIRQLARADQQEPRQQDQGAVVLPVVLDTPSVPQPSVPTPSVPTPSVRPPSVRPADP